jgi:hypothetical protein
MGKSLFTFFTNDGFYALLVQIGHNPNNFLPLLVVARIVWIVITISALVGACVYFFAKRDPRTLLILLLVAYFALTSTIAAFGTNPRYRLPVDPIIIALAAAGAAEISSRAQRFVSHFGAKKALYNGRMQSISDWQKTLKEAADLKFPNNSSGTFDRVQSIQEQLDDVKAALLVEQGLQKSDDHAHEDPNHRIGALVADIIILAEERGADIENELEKVLAWFKTSK